MTTLRILAVLILVLIVSSCTIFSNKPSSVNADVVFQENDINFTETQKDLILETIYNSEEEIRELLPNLPDSIQVIVENVDWNLDAVGGVTGRAEKNFPPLVLIQISNTYREGAIDSIFAGLKATIFHEFHHLSRGWAIQDNKFGPGISNAMVNEGLAVVFSEIYTGTIFEANSFSEEAHTWVNEILDLPLDASYSDWVMGEHPDGRTYIGYRTGNFLIRKAMSKSNKNIVELSTLQPEEIIKLAGY